MSLPGYDDWKLASPPEYDCEECEECGAEKRWDRIARADICDCNASEYFTPPDGDEDILDEAACFGGVDYP